MTTATRDFIGTHRATLAPLLAEGDHAADWDERIAEIENLHRLEDDWDGLGAPAPLASVIESAAGFARLLRDGSVLPPSRVAPGLGGAVLMEWQHGGGYYEIELSEPGEAEWVALVGGLEPRGAVLRW